MAVHVIRVPDLGEGIAEVELVAWHVQPGESISEDQGLADVMTDKASVEIPSPVAGKVLALGGEVGQMLAVGSDLIRIEIDDGTATTTAAPAAVASEAPEAIAAATNAREDAIAAAPSPPAPSKPVPAAAASPSQPAASPAVATTVARSGASSRPLASP
nr:biotin/lipoyl-containing protein [Caldimonas sp.]